MSSKAFQDIMDDLFLAVLHNTNSLMMSSELHCAIEPRGLESLYMSNVNVFSSLSVALALIMALDFIHFIDELHFLDRHSVDFLFSVTSSWKLNGALNRDFPQDGAS